MPRSCQISLRVSATCMVISSVSMAQGPAISTKRLLPPISKRLATFIFLVAIIASVCEQFLILEILKRTSKDLPFLQIYIYWQVKRT